MICDLCGMDIPKRQSLLNGDIRTCAERAYTVENLKLFAEYWREHYLQDLSSSYKRRVATAFGLAIGRILKDYWGFDVTYMIAHVLKEQQVSMLFIQSFIKSSEQADNKLEKLIKEGEKAFREQVTKEALPDCFGSRKMKEVV